MCEPTADQPQPPRARPVRLTPGEPPARAHAADDPMMLRSLPRWQAGIHVVVLVVTFIGLPFMYTTGMSLAGRDLEAASTAEMMLVSMGTFYAVILVAVLLLRETGDARRAIGLTSRSGRVDLALGLAGTLVSLAVFFLSVWVMVLVWPAGIEALTANRDHLPGMVPTDSLPLIGLLMVLVALGEETVFRGILMPHLRRVFGSWTLAVLFSTAIFAALHVFDQEPAIIYPLAGVALVWVGLTIWRRSVVPAIVAHAGFNTIQLWGALQAANEAVPPA